MIIKNVELPANISEQMSGKTLVISSVAEQKMNQQSDMQQVKQKTGPAMVRTRPENIDTTAAEPAVGLREVAVVLDGYSTGTVGN